MKNIKKLLCAVLTVVMMVSLMSAALAAGTFVDVPEDDPYAEYIEDLYARGITNGITATKFGPELTLNRAQFVTFIGRLAGVDRTKYTECPFDDITSDVKSWAGGYIEWAYALKITNGKSATKFAPTDPLNRLEMATFMLRFADAYGIKLKKSPNPAADLEEIASKYPDSVWKGAETAVKLFGGASIDLDENGNFNPKQAAMRKEMAKVISLFPVPEGGFVIPDDVTPAEGGNKVKINGTEYELKAGGQDSITLVNSYGTAIEYGGKKFTKIFTDAIADDAVVTIKCADGYDVPAMTGAQIKEAVFVFKVDGVEVNDKCKDNGVDYIFRLAVPPADGTNNGSAAKYVTEITISGGGEAPSTEPVSALKINGVVTTLKPSSGFSGEYVNKKGESVPFSGKEVSKVYNEIPENVPVTVVCADKEFEINSDQLRAAVFMFYKEGEAIADESEDGTVYAFRLVYPDEVGIFGTPEKYVKEINF